MENNQRLTRSRWGWLQRDLDAHRRPAEFMFTRFFAVLLLVLGFSLWSAQANDTASDPATAHVNLIVVDATINPAVADFIHESINRSAQEGAQALIIQLDTPGGLLNSTKSIVKDILGAPVPVIVYVAPSGAGAGSAGVFITMSGHIAAMAPGTTIGAAHPVGSGGQNIEGDMREKVENFTASFSETIAQRRGRNVEWAQKAVRESVSITEVEALQKKVIDLVAVDVQDLLRKAEDRKVEIGSTKTALNFKASRRADGTAEVVTLEMRLKHRVLNILADPNVAYLLMMAGILGLYIEFSHPGVLFPGLAGGICLLLALTAFQVLPINYTGLLLILLGLAFLIAELFLPSFGVLGVGGIVAFVLGSLFLFDTPEGELAVDRSIILTAALSVSAFMLFIGTLAVRTWRRKPVSGREGLIGESGEVRERLAPRGRVWLHGEHWTAESDEEIEVGQQVRVVSLSGLVLRVRKVAGK
ncbi:MAG: nodulation protein NfeD [Deltaproteobacteria bacterium]|nr:nodulation protein NfeD [Deltaproteobacteria bacterium]